MTKNKWDVEYGHITRESLLLQLSKHKINLNAYATILFIHGFTESDTPKNVTVIEKSIQELGFQNSANYEEIVSAAVKIGLEPCPLELAAYLRLQYLEQPEGSKLTVASIKPFTSEEYPNGFYLSHNDGSLWLRGYRASADWNWPPETRFAFQRKLSK